MATKSLKELNKITDTNGREILMIKSISNKALYCKPASISYLGTLPATVYPYSNFRIEGDSTDNFAYAYSSMDDNVAMCFLWFKYINNTWTVHKFDSPYYPTSWHLNTTTGYLYIFSSLGDTEPSDMISESASMYVVDMNRSTPSIVNTISLGSMFLGYFNGDAFSGFTIISSSSHNYTFCFDTWRVNNTGATKLNSTLLKVNGEIYSFTDDPEEYDVGSVHYEFVRMVNKSNVTQLRNADDSVTLDSITSFTSGVGICARLSYSGSLVIVDVYSNQGEVTAFDTTIDDYCGMGSIATISRKTNSENTHNAPRNSSGYARASAGRSSIHTALTGLSVKMPAPGAKATGGKSDQLIGALTDLSYPYVLNMYNTDSYFGGPAILQYIYNNVVYDTVSVGEDDYVAAWLMTAHGTFCLFESGKLYYFYV